MPWIPFWRMTSSSIPRRASRPPWIFGCSVLTRPSMISGKPVNSLTSVTVNPASRSTRAVPPVEIRDDAVRAESARQFDHAGFVGNAQERMPDRDDAGIGHERKSPCRWCGRSIAHYKRAAYSSPRRTSFLRSVARLMPSAAAAVLLLLVGPRQHFTEQRAFDFLQHQLIEAVGHLLVHVGQIAAHGARDALAQRGLQRGFGCRIGMRRRGGHDGGNSRGGNCLNVSRCRNRTQHQSARDGEGILQPTRGVDKCGASCNFRRT